MAKYLRIAAIALLALAIILSCTVAGNRLTDPATYAHTIETLDRNRTTVLGLSAASAAASAAVSALPDDICSSISEQISEFTVWFTLILGFIYLEKYLLTIFGAAACYLLIPVGCGALLIHCFFPRGGLRSMGTKLLILAAAVLLVIPSSVWISDQINAIYAQSIEITVESASAVSDNLIGEVTDENQESTTVIDEAKAILGDVSGSVARVIQQFKNVLNRFIEATAVMIVTSCILPILVVMCYLWLVKTLFNVPIVIPAPHMRPKKMRPPQGEEKERLLTE